VFTLLCCSLQICPSHVSALGGEMVMALKVSTLEPLEQELRWVIDSIMVAVARDFYFSSLSCLCYSIGVWC
jgi:hypothetical protein